MNNNARNVAELQVNVALAEIDIKLQLGERNLCLIFTDFLVKILGRRKGKKGVSQLLFNRFSLF